MHHDDMVCMLWSIITNVHKSRCRQYSMASLDRQVTQNGLGIINAMARGMYNGVVEVTVLAYGSDGDVLSESMIAWR